MSIFWGGFKSRRKTQHCIHEYQSRQPEEPSEEPILETTNQLPHHVETATTLEVKPSDATEVNPSVTPPIARDSKGRCQICRNEQLAARKYRIRLIIGKLQVVQALFPCHTVPFEYDLKILGIFFPFALQALDTTIVASALSRVASDFGNYLTLSIDMPTNFIRRTETDELHYLNIQFVLCYLYPLLGSDW
jgi:hypothetical protein